MSRARRTPPKPAKSAKADARPVPERLLSAALKLLQTEGLQAMSQARVAAMAGLRQSHLTYYFPTRKDLIVALVETIHGEMRETMRAALPDDGPSRLSVDDVREMFAARARDPLMARLMLAFMNAADETPASRRWLVDFDNDIIAQLQAIFAKLGLRPSEDDIALLHASLVGAAVLGAQVSPDPKSGADRAEHLTRLAFDRLVAAARRLEVAT
jgi:AcrR family transcriptional regulator